MLSEITCLEHHPRSGHTDIRIRLRPGAWRTINLYLYSSDSGTAATGTAHRPSASRGGGLGKLPPHPIPNSHTSYTVSVCCHHWHCRNCELASRRQPYQLTAVCGQCTVVKVTLTGRPERNTLFTGFECGAIRIFSSTDFNSMSSLQISTRLRVGSCISLTPVTPHTYPVRVPDASRRLSSHFSYPVDTESVPVCCSLHVDVHPQRSLISR